MTSSINYADKISKLLRKAESTDSAAEAEALRERAFELMAKHSVSEAQLDRAKPTAEQEKIVRQAVALTGIYRDALVTLVHRATQSFGTMTGYVVKNTVIRYYLPDAKPDARGHIYFIVGFASDVDRMQMLAESLRLQAISEMNQWWRSAEAQSLRRRTKMEQYKDRREFIFSFAAGVSSKISATMRKATEDGGTGTELALRDRKTLVSDWLKANTALKRRNSRITSGSYDAERAGYAAGLRSDIGQTALHD
jgi:hypothetical protein